MKKIFFFLVDNISNCGKIYIYIINNIINGIKCKKNALIYY